jgi:hypothetical protein
MNKPFLLLLGAIAISGGWAIVSADSVASASGQPVADSPLVLGVASSHHEPAPAIDITPAAPAAAAAPPAPASAPAVLPVIPAAVSMAQAREHGDDRAPPIDATAPDQAAPSPTPWELADEQRYLAFEQREQQRVRAAYLKAAGETLPQWRAAIEEARARGMAADDIAQAEEKVKRLEAVQADLRRPEKGGGR